MTRPWKGISIILGILIIFVLFYLYIRYNESKQPAGTSEQRTVIDTSLRNDTADYDKSEDSDPTEPKTSEGSTAPKNPTGNNESDDTANSGTSADSRSGFVVFDGTNFHPQPPELTSAGLKPIDVVYSTRMFDGKNAQRLKEEEATELPPKGKVYELASRAAQINNIGVIDIEHWMLNPEKDVSDAEIQANLERHLTVLEWYQQAEPNMNWGYYGEVPIRNYWASIRSRTSERYQRWMKANDRLKPLADKVDAFFVSLYTFYDDRERWVRYAREHIAEARRLNPNIPVYVYLWPEYHMSNDEIGLQPIEPDFWQLQLETAQEYADGVVIYTRGKKDFNPSAPWWQITKNFIEELNTPSEP